MRFCARRALALPVILLTASCSQVNSTRGAGGVAIRLQPNTVTIAPGLSLPLVASVVGSSDIQVMWSLAEGAAAGSITTEGLYTAPPSVGTFHAIATSHADPSTSELAVITVSNGGAGGGGATGGMAGMSIGGDAPATGGVTGVGGIASAGGVTSSGAVISSTASIQLIGNKIYDSAGNVIVARGPEDVMASTGQTQDIDQAAAMGANAMRMLFTLDAKNNMTPAGFDALLAKAVAHHMLVWVSLYTWNASGNNAIASALGGGNFYSLTSPVDGMTCSSATPSSCYLAVWNRQWLKDLMSKYRSNVIIDASQEYVDTGANPSSEPGRVAWATSSKTNVQFFRAQGYSNPLEIMANVSGRDLYCIVKYGDAIRAVDTVIVHGNPQTMFGWQAYWGTTDGWYPSWQGGLLLGKSGIVTGAQAIHQYAATQSFPIQIGIDNYASDTNQDYQSEIDQAAADGMSWLWWSWRNGTIECPASGATCQSYVSGSQNGFRGAKPLTN